LHHLECDIVLVIAAVEEEKCGDHVQRRVIVFLSLGQLCTISNCDQRRSLPARGSIRSGAAHIPGGC
jgi:hypothetical protein